MTDLSEEITRLAKEESEKLPTIPFMAIKVDRRIGADKLVKVFGLYSTAEDAMAVCVEDYGTEIEWKATGTSAGGTSYFHRLGRPDPKVHYYVDEIPIRLPGDQRVGRDWN